MYIAESEHIGRVCYKCTEPIEENMRITHDRSPAKRGVRHADCDRPFDASDESADPEPAPSVAAPPATNDPMAIMAQAMFPHMETLIKNMNTAGINADQLRAEVEAQIAKIREPKTIRVEIVEPKTGTTKTVEAAHRSFPVLLQVIQALPPRKRNVYLYGGPGGGKTEMARQLAHALDREFSFIQLNPQSPEWKLFGYLDAMGKYVPTPFFKAYTEGGVFLLGEMDNAAGTLLTALNMALDNGTAAFPHGIFPRHENCIVLGDGNTAGMGGTHGHAERRELDMATRARFFFLPVAYDEALETKISESIAPNGGAWRQWIRSVRAYLDNNKIHKIVASPRETYNGAELVKAGVPIEIIAEGYVFRGIEADLRAKILNLYPLPKA
jgi:hypothetical protein